MFAEIEASYTVLSYMPVLPQSVLKGSAPHMPSMHTLKSLKIWGHIRRYHSFQSLDWHTVDIHHSSAM